MQSKLTGTFGEPFDIRWAPAYRPYTVPPFPVKVSVLVIYGVVGFPRLSERRSATTQREIRELLTVTSSVSRSGTRDRSNKVEACAERSSVTALEAGVDTLTGSVGAIVRSSRLSQPAVDLPVCAFAVRKVPIVAAGIR